MSEKLVYKRRDNTPHVTTVETNFINPGGSPHSGMIGQVLKIVKVPCRSMY